MSEPEAIPRRGRLKRTLPVLLTLAALVHPLATLAARRDWRADLLTHFQVPALAASLAAAGSLWVARRRWLALGPAVLATVQLGPLFAYLGPNPVPPASPTSGRVRILMANVLATNEDHEALARLIRRERPDVVGLVEYSHAWQRRLEALQAEFPYRVEAPAGTRGLALWFRRPPRAVGGPERPSPGGWPLLWATIDVGGQPCRLWLVHPSNPLSRPASPAVNPELDALARQVGAEPGPRIVVGDLNCTEGSPHFGDFLRTSGLRDSRLGFGRQPSWPVQLPYRIPIDHAFVSADLAVVARRLGPDVGSDHFPLILDVAPAAIAATKPADHASQASP